MSIALENHQIQRSGLRHGMTCGSVFESSSDSARPIAGIFAGERRLSEAKSVREEEDVGESSSSSSIGRNSDLSGGESDGEGEVQSSHKGALDALDALEEVLPIKRGISNFYCGKSKSFTSLADATSCSSIKEIVKPENAYTRKRKNLLAHSIFWDKNNNNPLRSNTGAISKKPANSNRSTFSLAGPMNNFESSNNSESSDSNSSSPILCRPPLHPHSRRLPNNESPPSPPQHNFSPWRSFSLSDLQGAAAETPSITGFVISNADKDKLQ